MKNEQKKLFEKILEEETVSEAWKRSRVTIIHKGSGKPKDSLGSYWPIAVINVKAKLFGTVISEKLKWYAEENNVWGWKNKWDLGKAEEA